MELGVILYIDDFAFPLLPKDSLDFNYDRSIPKIDIPGTDPVYQDMGTNEKTLDFSGTINQSDALDISQLIISKWKSGSELQLSYGDVQERVRIQRYAPKVKRSDRVDYTIHLIICTAESQTPTTTQTSSSTTTTTIPALSDTMDRSYTIKDGDTLWGIASRSDVYGDGTKWEIIAKANNITDEYSLQIGHVIQLPSQSNVPASETAYNNANNTALGTTGQSELEIIAAGAS